MEITGRGGIQQNGPRDITSIFFPVFLLNGPSYDIGIEEKVLKGRL